MTTLSVDAPVRGVFVMLDGSRNEYPRATGWVICGGLLSVRRKTGKYSFQEFAVFGRLDQVGYMGDAA